MKDGVHVKKKMTPEVDSFCLFLDGFLIINLYFTGPLKLYCSEAGSRCPKNTPPPPHISFHVALLAHNITTEHIHFKNTCKLSQNIIFSRTKKKRKVLVMFRLIDMMLLLRWSPLAGSNDMLANQLS